MDNLKMKQDKIISDTLRYLSCKMIEKAESGHPGLPLGFADAITALIQHFNFDPQNPYWINRDRLVFSCGHGSALWYSVLYGYGILNENDLDNFRQIYSKTPGHLEKSQGIDISTGPLGLGFASAVGLAIAQKKLASQDANINHKTYIICSDGDLMEGISYEAAEIAGHYKLNNIIALWDDNSITIDGSACRSENMKMRFEAQNWNYISVDGHCIESVSDAISKAKFSEKPTLIACKTIIGKYSKLAGSNKAHGAPLGQINFEELKNNLNYDIEIFKKEFEKIKEKNHSNFLKWRSDCYSDYNSEKKSIQINKSEELKIKLSQSIATRMHSYYILDELLKNNDNLIILSADLFTSCKTNPPSGKMISKEDFSGNLLQCGIRENAMVAIAIGITEHSILTAMTSTFLTFYDFARPSIRLAALMKTPILMIATHDSVLIGEDGPTHQPVEHLDSLRIMPNLKIGRPADGFETFFCYEECLNYKGPSLIALSRHDLSNIHKNFIEIEDLAFNKTSNLSNVLLIASGSESATALKIASCNNFDFISFPFCEKRFFKQFEKHFVGKKIHIIEAATCATWKTFLPDSVIYSISEFGHSGKIEDIVKHFQLSQEVLAKIICKNSQSN